MIVRILAEGQYELDDAELTALEALDVELNAAIEAGDEPTFERLLTEAVTKVRAAGTKVDPGRLVTSDLTLPHEGSSLEWVRELLASEDSGES